MNFDRYWEDSDEYLNETSIPNRYVQKEMREDSKLVKNRVLEKFLKEMWRNYSEFVDFKGNQKHDIGHYLGEKLWLQQPEYPSLIRSIINVFDEYDEEIEKRVHDKLCYNYAKIVVNKNEQIKNLQQFIKKYIKKSDVDGCSRYPELPEMATCYNLKKKWIPIPEAAAFLGMCQSNVRYYKDKGVLLSKMKGGSYYINVESLVALKRLRDSNDYKEDNINELLKKKECLNVLIDAYDRVEKDYDESLRAYKHNQILETGINSDLIRNRLALFIDSFRGQGISDRNLNIIYDLYVGNPHSALPTLSMLAEKYNLTPERIRQIVMKTQRLMSIKGETRLIETKKLENEIVYLRTSLRYTSEELSKSIQDSKNPSKLSEIQIGEDDETSGDYFNDMKKKIIGLQTDKLIEHNFSVRALNCFKANNLESMYDLIKCSREDLLSFRQFGKKSLTEIEDYLESINLHLGTDFSVIEEILAKHW